MVLAWLGHNWLSTNQLECSLVCRVHTVLWGLLVYIKRFGQASPPQARMYLMNSTLMVLFADIIWLQVVNNACSVPYNISKTCHITDLYRNISVQIISPPSPSCTKPFWLTLCLGRCGSCTTTEYCAAMGCITLWGLKLKVSCTECHEYSLTVEDTSSSAYDALETSLTDSLYRQDTVPLSTNIMCINIIANEVAWYWLKCVRPLHATIPALPTLSLLRGWEAGSKLTAI